jgi:hypothetical protein
VVKVGKGLPRQGRTQNGSGLPIVTNPPDQTKNQRVLHVEHPTNPYRNPCSRCETDWWFWIGLPTLTRIRIWLGHHYNIVLPTLTSRGVEYTHNDINDTVLHSNRGPTRIRPIPQEHTQKKVVGDGGAQHRYMAPPTTWHSVADPHAASTIPQGGPPGLDPTTTPIEAYDVYSRVEANNFGKDFLRMAGIVQMLLALQPPYDKYSYHAHRKRKRLTQPRNQKGASASMASQIPGPCRTRRGVSSHSKDCGVCSSPIWLILINLITAVYYIVSVHKSISIGVG